jgi:polyhydroxybutyrate depolymerase
MERKMISNKGDKMKRTFLNSLTKLLKGILITNLLFLAQTGLSQDMEFERGINNVSLKHENVDREFIVYLPKNFESERTYPIFFAFHAGGGTKEKMAEKWLTDYLDKYDWIGVIPQGLLRSWNAEDIEGFAGLISTADDIGFVIKMVDYLRQNFSIDDRRIYTYGISNGSVMVYTLARKTSIFAAIIPQSGTMLEVQALLPGTERLSVFHIHGTKDDQVLYEGGISKNLPIPFKSVRKTVDIWARHNGSEKEPVLEKREGGLSVHRYPDCQDGTKVILFSFDDGPHDIKPKVVEFKLLDEIFSLIAGQTR